MEGKLRLGSPLGTSVPVLRTNPLSALKGELTYGESTAPPREAYSPEQRQGGGCRGRPQGQAVTSPGQLTRL